MGWVARSMLKYWRKVIPMFQHAFGEPNPEWPEITVEELHERFDTNPPALLIDVRSKDEYEGNYGHLPNAKWIPMLDLESRISEIIEYKDSEVVTMCPGGGMSLVAVDLLKEAGFTDVKSLLDGTDAWHKKGYPMEFGESKN